MRIRAGDPDCLLRGGKLLLGCGQVAFRDARGGFNGIELIFGDVVGAEQRSVAGQIGSGRDRWWLVWRPRWPRRLADSRSRTVRAAPGSLRNRRHRILSERTAPLVLLGGGCARQADLEFRGICLRFREIEVGFGLFHFRLIGARIDLHQADRLLSPACCR